MRQLDSSAKTIKNITKIAKFVFFGLVILAIILLLIQNNVSFAALTPCPIPDSALTAWVDNLMILVSSTIGVLAVVMIIIAGIVYMFDLGGGKQVGLAKDIIITTISGLLLFIIASWLLGEINSIFPALCENPGVQSQDPGSGGGGNDDPFSPGEYSPPGGSGGDGGYVPPGSPGIPGGTPPSH